MSKENNPSNKVEVFDVAEGSPIWALRAGKKVPSQKLANKNGLVGQYLGWMREGGQLEEDVEDGENVIFLRDPIPALQEDD